MDHTGDVLTGAGPDPQRHLQASDGILLRDICRLSSEEVEDCLAWIVRSIVCATSQATSTPPAQPGL
jgi:hypothetical protein